MEEIIELCRKKYPNFYILEIYRDGSCGITRNDYATLAVFDSIEELRNHLNG